MASIGGRILNIELENGSTLKINVDRSLSTSANTVFLLTKNTGEVFQPTVTQAVSAQPYVFVNNNFSVDEVLPYATFCTNPKYFKIIKLLESEKRTRWQITGIQHFPEKYDFIDAVGSTPVSAN